MNINEVTGAIVDAAMDVHTSLGPGLLESAYEACLQYELVNRGYEVVSQMELPIIYRDKTISAGYRIDLLVEAQGHL